MRYLFFVLFLLGCSHNPPTPRKDLVSVQVALDQAQASYLKGCVDGLKDYKISRIYPTCRKKSQLHRQELNEIMDQGL